jgi:hypothetical protein
MSNPCEDSNKKLICRFHGGHLDGEFDSHRDLSYAAKSSKAMKVRYWNAYPGQCFDELPEAKLDLFLQGVSACRLFSDADGLYILLRRVETEDAIELDLVYAHVDPETTQPVLTGTFRGKSFLLPMPTSGGSSARGDV